MMRFSILMTTLGLSLLQSIPTLAISNFNKQSAFNDSESDFIAERTELIAQKPVLRRKKVRKKEESPTPKSRAKRSPRSKRSPSVTTKRKRAIPKARVRSVKKVKPTHVKSPRKNTPSRAKSVKRVVKEAPTRIRKRSQPQIRRKPVKIETISPTVRRRKQNKTVIRKAQPNRRIKAKVAPQKLKVAPQKIPKKDSRGDQKVKRSIRRRRTDRVKVIKKPTVKKVVPAKKVIPAKKVVRTKKVVPAKKVIPAKKVVPAKKVKPVITKAKVKRVKPLSRRKIVRRQSDFSRSRSHSRKKYPLQTRHSRRKFSNNRFRRVVRRRRSTPFWGRRRVRSRRLTRAYRPCYYCPGRGWSFRPDCNTRARRFFVFSDSYASLLPTFRRTSSRRRRSFNDQFLAEQVEAAILDYAELYELEDFDDNLKITQDDSDIILSGEVENEEILEDIVAIARDTDGVDDVITDDVIVLYPSESSDEFPDAFDPALDNFEQEEPELIFTTAFDDRFSEDFDD